jgi:hypothetical protein
VKNENIERLSKELESIWNRDRASSFIEKIGGILDEDQFECLSKMIPYISEETPNLDEKVLEEITKSLDTFDGSLEFLEYFFKLMQPESVDDIMGTLKADPEEVIDLLESMEDQGVIQYLVEFESFYVWYR